MKKKSWQSNNRYTFLIGSILEMFGGEKGFREFLLEKDSNIQINRMVAFHWRNKGFIPRKWVFQIADILGCSPFALNFKQLKDSLKDDITWAQAVGSCSKFLPKEVINRAVKMTR